MKLGLSPVLLLLSACAHEPARTTHSGRPGGTERSETAETGVLVAQGCSPGMSCFGHVLVLPNGEVAEAATAAAAAATAATMANAQATKETKTKEKSAEKERVDTATRLKRKVICELKGGNVKQPNQKIRCSYYCPGDPSSASHDILLDIPECPRFWDFYL